MVHTANGMPPSNEKELAAALITTWMNPKYVLLSERETEAEGYVLSDSIDRTFSGRGEKQNHRDRKQMGLC